MAFVSDDVAPSEASGVSATAAARPDESEEHCGECPAVAPVVNGNVPQDPEAEWMDELELALRKALQARCFEALDDTRNTLLATTQLTISNVMSTVVTALQHRESHRKRSKQLSTPLAIEGNQESRETIYGAPRPSAKVLSRFKKGRRGSQQHQAQLPAFRRSLPALTIPVTRLHHELLRERDAFMAQLAREREEKAQLEDWAATRIQACYRGFRSRPRIVAYARRLKRQAMRSLSAIRLDLAGMQENLKRRENPPVEAGATGDGESTALPWRKGVKHHASRKRALKTRQEERQHAASRIQACARRFLARIAFGHLVSRARDERYLAAVVKIQSVSRGYLLRAKIQRVVPRLQEQAALHIQSLLRGLHARERVCMLRFERECEERRLAGLPLQFSLASSRIVGAHEPARTSSYPAHSDSSRSSIRSLIENRKSRSALEFKNTRWREQRLFLRIHIVAQKLLARRARLVHRWNWTKSSVLDKHRQKRSRKLLSTLSSLSSLSSKAGGVGIGRRSSHRRLLEKPGSPGHLASPSRDAPVQASG